MYNFKSRNGNVLGGLLALGLVSALAVVYSTLTLQTQKDTLKAIVKKNYPITSGSAIEAAMLAFHAAEAKYYTAAGQMFTPGSASSLCAHPLRSFLKAFYLGLGCADAQNHAVSSAHMNLFANSDWAPNTPPDFIEYGSASGCDFQSLSKASCLSSSSNIPLLIVGRNRTDLFGGEHSFYLERYDSANRIVSLLVKVKNGLSRSEYRVGLRWDSGNMAHLRPTGEVVQERPDPGSTCPGDLRVGRKGKPLHPWGPLYTFDEKQAKCRSFAQLGSGTSLAFYDNRYLGFRKWDGQMVSFNELTNDGDAPYLISEDGFLQSKTAQTAKKVGFEYAKEGLRFADDLTVVNGHIYFVMGQGEQTKIVYLSRGECPAGLGPSVHDSTPAKSAWCRIPVCNLGALGFATRFSGIATAAWAQSLFRTDGSPEPLGGVARIANFHLKTLATGNLLRVVVRNNPGQTAYTSCTVVIDSEDQAPEYRATYGFDRAADERPYFVY